MPRRVSPPDSRKTQRIIGPRPASAGRRRHDPVLTGIGEREVLGVRALNRALLARQFLLERTRKRPEAVVQHLVGLQAQAPLPPYYGLWSRVEGFEPAHLSKLLLDRKVVRIALMRSTLHLVTAADCCALRPLVQPVSERAVTGTFGKLLDGLPLDEIEREGRALVEAAPLTTAELGAALAARWPGRHRLALTNVVRARVPLVQLPPRGLWGEGGLPTVTSAEVWLGRPLGSALTLEELFLRYLKAFGPASVKDAQVWCGLTTLGPAAERLRSRLLAFEDENGRELFDLPDAPRPDPEEPAPVRLVAEFDNILLSHHDRSRIMNADARRRISTVNGIFPGTVLVDGFVRGTWKLERKKAAASVRITPFEPLTRRQQREVELEAQRLLGFAAPEGGSRQVHFARG